MSFIIGYSSEKGKVSFAEKPVQHKTKAEAVAEAIRLSKSGIKTSGKYIVFDIVDFVEVKEKFCGEF